MQTQARQEKQTPLRPGLIICLVGGLGAGHANRGGASAQPAFFALLLYSLLMQYLPLQWVIPPVRQAPQESPANDLPQKVTLQYTSGRHVLGFGASQVYVAHPTHALTLTLVDAKPVEPVALAPTEENEPAHDISAPAPGSASQPFTGRVRYANPWPGVSVVYRAQAGAIVKSEYHLEPGFTAATLKQIRIGYNRPVAITPDGGLRIDYDLGQMTESRPVAWQVIDGTKKTVMCQFVKQGKRTIGFAASGYNKQHQLIIDPSLVWNTFVGRHESESDAGNGLAIDTAGNVYVTGNSDGTWGAGPKRAYTGDLDAYAAKLDSNGNLIWNTFLGGSGIDYGYAIAVDGGGNVYVGGGAMQPGATRSDRILLNMMRLPLNLMAMEICSGIRFSAERVLIMYTELQRMVAAMFMWAAIPRHHGAHLSGLIRIARMDLRLNSAALVLFSGIHFLEARDLITFAPSRWTVAVISIWRGMAMEPGALLFELIRVVMTYLPSNWIPVEICFGTRFWVEQEMNTAKGSPLTGAIMYTWQDMAQRIGELR